MQSSTGPAFRPDIEGLRALAVLLVVAAHARVPGLQGGYIGVDVFFVISGFLITRLLHAEWERHGRIDIPGFYARRIRRLLPAFLLMLAAVVAATWIIYAPVEQDWRLGSALSSLLYVSNIHYALTATDYMAPSAKLDPLLHTWSLGVEEQFYLAWPLLMLGAWRLAQRHRSRLDPVLLLLLGLTLASLAAAIILTASRQPLAFFLPLTRAWEFGAGALAALFGARLAMARPGAPAALALGGLALVLGSALAYTAQSPYPGWRALLPVAGTTLLLLAVPAAPGAPVARLLALPPLQWLGRLSYGWYLWHWPLLVLGRVVFPEGGLRTDLALAAMALLLAQASFTLVEQPLRQGPLLRRPLAALALAGAVALAGTLGLLRAQQHAREIGQGEPYARLTASFTDLPIIYSDKFNCDSWHYDDVLTECVGGDPRGRQTAVLLGDSHAGQWFSAFHTLMRERGWRLVVMTKSACPIIDQDYFYAAIGRTFTECGNWKRRAVKRLQRLRPALVIVSSAENYAFTPAEWAAGSQRILTRIAEASGHLVILRDTPNPGFSTPECLARQEWSPPLVRRACSFDPRDALSPAVLAAYRDVATQRPDVTLLDMTPRICPESPCRVTAGPLIKFRDGNHLTDSFVRSLTPALDASLVARGLLPPAPGAVAARP